MVLRCRAIAVLLALAATILSSCGDRSPDHAAQVEQTLEQIRQAFDAGDVAGVCALHAIERARCVATTRFLRDRGRLDTSSMRSGERRVLDVRVRGRRAVATVTLNKRVPGRLGLVERDGVWMPTDLRVRPIEDRSRWRTTSVISETVRATRTTGSGSTPCPATRLLSNSAYVALRGGCVLRLTGDEMPLLMLTSLGDFVVARCSSSFSIHLEPIASTMRVDRIRFRGPGMCAETRRCRDGETGLTYPWQGGKLRGPYEPMQTRFDICVNTPLGRARGMLYFRLDRRGTRWTATTDDYPIGESSIQIGGAWDVAPRDVRIQPTGY